MLTKLRYKNISMKNITTISLKSFFVTLSFLTVFVFGFGQTTLWGPEGFTSATFPPTGWAIDAAPISGFNWERHAPATDGGCGATPAQARLRVSSEAWLYTQDFTAVAGMLYNLNYRDLGSTSASTFEIFVGQGPKQPSNATQSVNLRTAGLQGTGAYSATKSTNTWS